MTTSANTEDTVCALCLTRGGGHDDPTCPAANLGDTNDTLDAQLDEITLRLCASARRALHSDTPLKYQREARNEAKQALTKLIEAQNEYQTYVGYETGTTGNSFWVARIAYKGRQYYGDVFRSEEEAQAGLDKALAELRKEGDK